MRRLEKDESLCIGCHQCEEACSKAFYKVSDPMKSCIRITDKAVSYTHLDVYKRQDNTETVSFA